jgi:AcrR family transcriptional regulator
VAHHAEGAPHHHAEQPDKQKNGEGIVVEVGEERLLENTGEDDASDGRPKGGDERAPVLLPRDCRATLCREVNPSFVAALGSSARLHVKALYMNPGDRGWRRPRSYHHGNLKEVLLEAARKLIEEHGAFGFSLTEAARLAGVSPAAPYRHFRDRDALLAEVAKNGFERFAARLDMAWNNGVPTPLSAFDNLGKAYLAFARDEPASYTVMFETGVLPGGDGETLTAAERAFDVLQHAAAALCRQLPESERPPLKLMSLHIWAISHGVATLFAQGDLQAHKVPMKPEEILESAMLVYLKGLGILADGKGAQHRS